MSSKVEASKTPARTEVEIGGRWYLVTDDKGEPKAAPPSLSSAAASVAYEPPSKDGGGVKAAPVELPKTISGISAQAFRRVMLENHLSKGRLVKGAGRKGGPNIFRGNVQANFGLATNASGVYQISIGAATFASCADFTSFSTLFDISRVSGIHVKVLPYAAGAAPSTLTTLAAGLHVPMLMAFDPEAYVSSTWASLTSTRDWTDKKLNIATTTSHALSHTFPVAEQKKVLAESSGALAPALGQWMDNLLYVSTNVGGSVLAAIYPSPLNVSALLCQFMVTFICDWSYRL